MLFRLLATLIACAALAACATGKSSGPSVAASRGAGLQLHPADPDPVQRRRPHLDRLRQERVHLSELRHADDAIQAMKEQAGQAGATGILNVMCMDGNGWSNGQQLCYGDAIKFKSSSN